MDRAPPGSTSASASASTSTSTSAPGLGPDPGSVTLLPIAGPSSAGSSGEAPSIRAYRARKLRPCDNCRRRRKRCLIPRSGDPCTLCVTTKKLCTFLYDRRRKSPGQGHDPSTSRTDATHFPSDTSREMPMSTQTSMQTTTFDPILAHRGTHNLSLTQSQRHRVEPAWSDERGMPVRDQSPVRATVPAMEPRERLSDWYTEPTAYHHHLNQGNPIPTFAPSDSIPSVSPQIYHSNGHVHAEPTAGGGSALDLINRIRRAGRDGLPHQPNIVDPLQQHPTALDDDAGEGEELFLAGTASERDALILNNLTSDSSSGTGHEVPLNPPAPGLRIRRVSPKVSFVFYKSQPYGPEILPEADTAWDQLERLIGSHLAENIVRRLLDIEGRGFPIFSAAQHASPVTLPETLRCFALTAGLIYTPSLRHLHHHAYMITMRQVRQRAPSARLWTLQMHLLDLNGREAINPSGNFIVLGLAVSLSRLLGLHEDCSDWTIPDWEKDLRCKLWWALLVYDKISSITFGRARTIHTKNTVPLPSFTAQSSPSLLAFVSLCELSVLLDHFDHACGCPSDLDQLEHLAFIAFELEQWKIAATSRGIFQSSDLNVRSAPGVQSLHLIYLGSTLMVFRETLDQSEGRGAEAADACQRGCLKACEDIIDFVAGLTADDLGGYWSSHSPFFLSSCLTLLIRLITSSDRSDQSDGAIWQAALFALRRFISTLVACSSESQWDVAQLALSRAQYFIPLLSRQASEFQVTLLPLSSQRDELGPGDQAQVPFDADGNNQALNDFLNSLVDTFGLDFLT
ncbi:hypothetical protein IAU60_003790 [Kwoniella sp. DSM 27419]